MPHKQCLDRAGNAGHAIRDGTATVRPPRVGWPVCLLLLERGWEFRRQLVRRRDPTPARGRGTAAQSGPTRAHAERNRSPLERRPRPGGNSSCQRAPAGGCSEPARRSQVVERGLFRVVREGRRYRRTNSPALETKASVTGETSGLPTLSNRLPAIQGPRGKIFWMGRFFGLGELKGRGQNSRGRVRPQRDYLERLDQQPGRPGGRRRA